MSQSERVTAEETEPTPREYEFARFHVNDLILRGTPLDNELADSMTEWLACILCVYRLEQKTGIPVEAMDS